MKLTFLIAALVFLTGTSTNPQQSGKKLKYADETYEEEIRTVQLYPNTGNPYDIFSSPVAAVGRNNLLLEFDDLVEAHEQYRVKIIHCNSDWKPSKLKMLDYLFDFNEFNITNFEYSTDVKIGYVHYRFKLPPIKYPGNYVLVAYRGTNENDIILSKRFMIYGSRINVELLSNLQGMSSMSQERQQIDFRLTYEENTLINPLERIKVVLRQNQQDYNAIRNLKPSFFREGLLEYRFFNFENNFSAGNEYRFFDMRSLRYPGQNVGTIDLTKRPSETYLQTEAPRIYQAYAQYEDINGNFVIQNQDTGGSSESDYLFTTFTLAMKEPLPGEIYAVGKMNDYSLDESTKMTYDKRAKAYKGTQLLKQGFYNYKYVVKNDTLDYNYLEGNHFETENEYEMFIYYDPPELRGEQLIGYRQFVINDRN